jgi:hypothetical protein
MFRFMKKRKAPVKNAPAKKVVAKKTKAKVQARVKAVKAKPVKAVVPKAGAAKVTGRQWGEGPWALPRVRGSEGERVRGAPAPVAEVRPALEDVFNHQVKRQYAPLRRLQAPRGALNWRVILIVIAVLMWIVALFHPFK